MPGNTTHALAMKNATTMKSTKFTGHGVCDYDDDTAEYDCENVRTDDNGDDVECPYNGWCECDSDCFFEYDMELYWDNCGCYSGYEFCNYDDGDYGSCESCTDDNGDDVYADYDECWNDGLPDAGAAA